MSGAGFGVIASGAEMTLRCPLCALNPVIRNGL